MSRQPSTAQVACGVVAGVGIALGATGGLTLVSAVYGGGSDASPVVVARTGSARAPASVAKVAQARPEAKAAPRKATKPKASSRVRKPARSHRRAPKRASPKRASPAVSRPQPVTTPVSQPVSTTTSPVVRTPPKRASTPSTTQRARPAATSPSTFDDSG